MGTMTDPVTFEHEGEVSTVTMDDGKVNVFSPTMLRALHAAFDEAERAGGAVLLTGRPGCFSAGFDLHVLREQPDEVVPLLRQGATLAQRILSFPAPVVVACTGHAYPAGAFLLMAADVRVGADGPFRLGLNEVRIGMALPEFAVVLARHRLTPAAFDRTAVTGTMFGPREPRSRACSTTSSHLASCADAARAAAEDLATLDRRAHRTTKRRVRAPVLAELAAAIEAELTLPGAPASAPGECATGVPPGAPAPSLPMP